MPASRQQKLGSCSEGELDRFAFPSAIPLHNVEMTRDGGWREGEEKLYGPNGPRLVSPPARRRLEISFICYLGGDGFSAASAAFFLARSLAPFGRDDIDNGERAEGRRERKRKRRKSGKRGGERACKWPQAPTAAARPSYRRLVFLFRPVFARDAPDPA